MSACVDPDFLGIIREFKSQFEQSATSIEQLRSNLNSVLFRAETCWQDEQAAKVIEHTRGANAAISVALCALHMDTMTFIEKQESWFETWQ